MKFKLRSKFKPAGQQPQAIQAILQNLSCGVNNQTLLGVTGSGKTFTMACVIEKWQRPVLVASHNKVLAAQLYAEFKSFFPNNAVEYFISYYDYYLPEAYIPQSDTYIEKDAAINEHIERLRLKATTSLLTRKDVIVVASVSCIYNIGDPTDFAHMCVEVKPGHGQGRDHLMGQLVAMQYERNDLELAPGRYRARGGRIDIFPPYLEHPLRVSFDGDIVESVETIHKVTAAALSRHKVVHLYPARHFVTPKERIDSALIDIEKEMNERAAALKAQDRLLEAQRIVTRTRYDMAMMRTLGFCNGIENYSRYLAGRGAGERPYCLMDYFPKDFLFIVDESHVTLPQFGGMYEGDRSRKGVLVEHGFRLPSALDNRPLKFKEVESVVGQSIYVSATPGPYELSHSADKVIELVVRPTGLVDPPVEVHPIKGQIEDLMHRVKACADKKQRALVNTLTKRTAEDLADFLTRKGLAVRYLHSDIDSLQRIKILKELRQGQFDALIGVNLLREGLDIPEVTLVAVLDADKEGFLRSETSIIQLCGRAARNLDGQVVLYADNMTGSMQRALGEMQRRRELQVAYNKEHKITPRTIIKEIAELSEFEKMARRKGLSLTSESLLAAKDKKSLPLLVKELESEMKEAAERLDFELAAILRDQISEIKSALRVRV